MDQETTLGEMAAAHAEEAVLHAKTAWGFTLDYSLRSVELVEAILDKAHAAISAGAVDRFLRRGPSEDDVDAMAKIYGSYVGEVLRRVADSKWDIDLHTVPGETLICLRRDTVIIYPSEKVRKRLTNGREDNLSFYVHILMEKVWK
jgi:hypothetical protein